MYSILDGLNEVQRAAATHKGGPEMVLAGAGSGKTRVLTTRIAWLIEQGVEPSAIVAITFTNKAANEMKERVLHLLHSTNTPTLQHSNASTPYVGTFHALCVRILRQQSKHIGIPSNFSIYDETDANALIKQVMKKFDISTKKVNPKAIKSAISSAKNELVAPNDYVSYGRGYFQEIVAKIYPEYQRLLRENQAMDFDDLLINAYMVLNGIPEVLDYYNNKWHYILVDEYQDTNKVQYLLAKLLARKDNNITVVGDAAQSIYAFRGADLRNIKQFMKDYPTVQVFNLEQNYRSTQKILSTASSLIKPNKRSHPVLELWTDNDEGENITLYEASSGKDESEHVVSEVLRMSSVCNIADMAVLYRTNAQSRQFEEAFIRNNVPYKIVGGVKFYDRREIKDLIAYLRLIINPSDSVSYERIVNTPPRGIGAVTLLQGGPKLDAFHKMIEEFREKAKALNALELLDLIIEKVSYRDYILDGTEEGLARWENIQELRSVASTFTGNGNLESTLAFLESISLLEQSDISKMSGNRVRVADDEKPNAVTLMTLHAAKGLEFAVVFLVGLEEGLLPHSRSLDSRFDIEEERRLCYVGVTRAKEILHLSYARTRTQFASFQANAPSRFLRDIPMEYVEMVKAPSSFDQVPKRFDSLSDTEWVYPDEYDNYSLDYNVDTRVKKRPKNYEKDPLNKWEI